MSYLGHYHPVSVIRGPESFLAAAHSPHQTGGQHWQLVVSIGVILGIVVAIGTFADWGNRIRNRRVDRRVLELVRDQLMAEDIEGRVKQLGELNRKLQAEIDRLPAQANRLFQQQRMGDLAASIAHDFDEYQKLETAVGVATPATGLNPLIRQAIERTMVSPQKRRDRRNLYTLVLLVVLVALNFIPISVNQFVYEYFGTLTYSPTLPGEAVISVVIIGSIVIAATLLFLAELFPKLLPGLDRLRRPAWLIGLSIAIVLSAGVGYWSRSLAIGEACFPYGCASTPNAFIVAGTVLNIVPFLAGVWLALLARAAWLKRTADESLRLIRRRPASATEKASTGSSSPARPESAPASERVGGQAPPDTTTQ